MKLRLGKSSMSWKHAKLTLHEDDYCQRSLIHKSDIQSDIILRIMDEPSGILEIENSQFYGFSIFDQQILRSDILNLISKYYPKIGDQAELYWGGDPRKIKKVDVFKCDELTLISEWTDEFYYTSPGEYVTSVSLYGFLRNPQDQNTDSIDLFCDLGNKFNLFLLDQAKSILVNLSNKQAVNNYLYNYKQY